MFPEIPRNEVTPAIQEIHDRICEVKLTRKPINFFIAKNGDRKQDNAKTGMAAAFHCLTLPDILSYVSWDLRFNTVFMSLSSVLCQLTGVPIGGSLSAQLASMVLISREIRARDVDPYFFGYHWSRYRDNFIFLCSVKKQPTLSMEESTGLALETIRRRLAIFFGMGTTLEQYGSSIGFLECQLGDPRGSDPLSTKYHPDVAKPGDSAPPQRLKMIPAHAPNARNTMASLIPNHIKKCAHYRLSLGSARDNIERFVSLLQKMQYPTSWWSIPLRRCSEKWGLPEVRLSENRGETDGRQRRIRFLSTLPNQETGKDMSQTKETQGVSKRRRQE
jgi:hypothetical protein